MNWSLYWASLVVALFGGLLVALDVPRTPFLSVAIRCAFVLGGIALLRASAGGVSSGVGVLSLLPVFYTALYRRSRIDLLIVLAEVAVFYLLPILLIGGPDYPTSQYRAALLVISVGAIVGFVTHRLVATVREERAKAESRGDMLERVSGTVHDLFASSDPRADVCTAAIAIARADAAMLCEPEGSRENLACRAASGSFSSSAQPLLGVRSSASEALHSGERVLIDSNPRLEFQDPDAWEAAGSPRSILYEPLLSEGVVVGLLIVGWSGRVQLEGPRATVVALLAHEAAAVIKRADQVAGLADDAHRDPLTGLPNRRAWTRRLQEYSRARKPMTVCILDLDRFKEFNDTHGHPAGDRLLRETAAAWRDELRGEDFLARIGGEEFGLLLHTDDPGDALDVVGRLRAGVAQRRTCSAGIAVRLSGETADDAVSRADQALYLAKESGRDRAIVAASVTGEPSTGTPESPRRVGS